MAPAYRGVQDDRYMKHHSEVYQCKYNSGSKDCTGSLIVHPTDPNHEHLSHKNRNAEVPSRLSILEARFTLSDVYGPENQPACPLHGGPRERPTSQLSLPTPPRELVATPTHRRRTRSRSPFPYARPEYESWDPPSAPGRTDGMRPNEPEAETPYSQGYGWVEPGKGWTRSTSGGRSHRRSVHCYRPMRINYRSYPQDQDASDTLITPLANQEGSEDINHIFHEDALGYPDKSGVISCDRRKNSDDPRHHDSNDWATAYLAGKEALLSRQGIADMTFRKNIEQEYEPQTDATGRKWAPYSEANRCSARLEETQRMMRVGRMNFYKKTCSGSRFSDVLIAQSRDLPPQGGSTQVPYWQFQSPTSRKRSFWRWDKDIAK